MTLLFSLVADGSCAVGLGNRLHVTNLQNSIIQHAESAEKLPTGVRLMPMMQVTPQKLG